MMPTNIPTLSITDQKSASSRACFPTSGFSKISWRCRFNTFQIQHNSDLHRNFHDRIRPSGFGTDLTVKHGYESKAVLSFRVCTKKQKSNNQRPKIFHKGESNKIISVPVAFCFSLADSQKKAKRDDV